MNFMNRVVSSIQKLKLRNEKEEAEENTHARQQSMQVLFTLISN